MKMIKMKENVKITTEYYQIHAKHIIFLLRLKITEKKGK